MKPPKYTNPKVPEDISSGHEHPLVDVAKSSAIVIALIAVVIAGSFFAARFVAPFLPFTWEKALAERVAPSALDNKTKDTATQMHLQALADRLSAAMELPDGMTVTVHFLEDERINAFATLGGHVFVFSGLWQRLGSENAMAMLLSHEIAHIKHRDPIRSVSGALLASLTAGAILGDAGVLGNVAGTGSLVTALHFSREQEAQADAEALAALFTLYGHLKGSIALFTVLQAATTDVARPPALLASHPDLPARIADIKSLAAGAGWSFEGETTPLP